MNIVASSYGFWIRGGSQVSNELKSENISQRITACDELNRDGKMWILRELFLCGCEMCFDESIIWLSSTFNNDSSALDGWMNESISSFIIIGRFQSTYLFPSSSHFHLFSTLKRHSTRKFCVVWQSVSPWPCSTVWRRVTLWWRACRPTKIRCCVAAECIPSPWLIAAPATIRPSGNCFMLL